MAGQPDPASPAASGVRRTWARIAARRPLDGGGSDDGAGVRSAHPAAGKWSLFSTLRHWVPDLFPTRKTKSAMWGLVLLGVLITYLELAAADLFSRLITNLDELTRTESGLLMVGFLGAFVGVRGISYFQSVYRLRVFEKSLRKLGSASPAAEAWSWPMAITIVAILGQIARLGTVIFAVATQAWMFGLLLVVCTVIAVVIVNRTGRRQYEIHRQFLAAKHSGQPPTPAERIGTRIRAGERAGLVTVGPVLVYVVALAIGAARGDVTTHSALVLFIAGRMAANMYGGLANATMRLIRFQVNVEEYGGQLRTTTDSRYVAPDEEVTDTLLAGEYLAEPPGQAGARMIDDGYFVGDMEAIGRRAREAGAGPQNWLRKHAPPTRPEELVAVAANQIWLHDAYTVPLSDPTSAVVVHVIDDAYSRAIVHWRLVDGLRADDILETFEEACRLDATDSAEIEFVSRTTMIGARPGVHDLLKSLGVVRTLLWVGPDGRPRTGSTRPEFPTRFGTPDEAAAWFTRFVTWYNDEFYQPTIGYLHPSVVHAGLADVVTAERLRTLETVTDTWPAPIRFPDEWLPPEDTRLALHSLTATPRSLHEAEVHTLEDDDDV